MGTMLSQYFWFPVFGGSMSSGISEKTTVFIATNRELGLLVSVCKHKYILKLRLTDLVEQIGQLDLLARCS